MTISFQCRACGTELTARDEHEGQDTACPRCNSPVCVPDSLDGLSEFVSVRRRRQKMYQRLRSAFRSIGDGVFHLMLAIAFMIGVAIVIGFAALLSSDQMVWRAAVLVLLFTGCLIEFNRSHS